ncbi:hypothetical protein LIPSTDRAFT_111378 [Lipomyces starkeyi NRRL Y-11557]|uniref:Uncharacterized protein n=1 Tax=Lipomyces starkeyi NRRL Y-11557 TaxID=675824 RepID=A0A1E3Q876_LIPST|nr:hypothetical protein LIPSTDRAFT_111378 [Lipomyces starkeyi NRRL Y-11557]
MLLQPIATVAASVVAAFFAAPAVDAAAHPAAVFAFPKSNAHQHDIPSLRPAEARLVFAERLGVSRFHKLGFQHTYVHRLLEDISVAIVLARDGLFVDKSFYGWILKKPTGQDMKVLELERFSGEHSGLWRDQSENIVVVISGVSNTKDAFTESSPAFFINDTPDTESFHNLATGFIGEAQQLVGDLSVRIFGNSQGSFISVVPDMDLCINGHQEVIPRTQCLTAEVDLTADFNKQNFGEFAKVFDAESSVDAAFMDEALAFNSFINNFAQSVKADNQLAVLFFNSLNSVLMQYGADSVKYNVASTVINNLLQKLVLETAPSTPITAVLLPANTQSSSSKKAKRGASKEAFGNQHVSPAVSVGILEPASYATQEECEITTNFCSGGHGICMQMYGQEGFYGCSCISTYDETTRQRTYWAGDYCQKYDVTVPFQIFFWFLIISILFLAWTIKAMLSIGAEELPAVLAAATMVQPKA